MKIFGFEIIRKKEIVTEPVSFVPPNAEDGAVTLSAAGSFTSTYVDLDGTVRTEAQLVEKYRDMVGHPEVCAAVDEITDEAISASEEKDIVKIILDDVDLKDNPKKVIEDEFKEVLKMLQFHKRGHDLFRKWYVDGRLYFHVVIDDANIKDGIKELRYVDPRKIRKIREVTKKRIDGAPTMGTSDSTFTQVVNEYYLYNENGFNTGGANKNGAPATGLRIASDSIIHTTSGVVDSTGTMVLSYLHKAIKVLNQLKTLEDSAVIYRLVRAPERRVWKIDVGNLPRHKAEQYMNDQMTRYKNRLVYDASSGQVRDDRKYLCYALDTKIPLLDGRTLTLQDLIDEHEGGKKNWVYSCDPTTGAFVPGPVSWAGITKHDSQVVRVTFDNGKSVVCTPDHKFPVWGKGFVEAQHLTPTDSIIPGYRRKKSVMRDGIEYEQIYKNDTQTWEFTHREVARWKDDVGLHEDRTFFDRYASAQKKVVHHVDFNGDNNSPENLVMMNYRDHMEYHRAIQSVEYTDDILAAVNECAWRRLSAEDAIKFVNETANVSAWRSINVGRHIKNRAVEDLTFTYKDLLKLTKRQGHKDWRSWRRTFDTRDRTASGLVRPEGRAIKYSQEWKDRLSDAAKRRDHVRCKTWKIVTPMGETLIIDNLNQYCRDVGLNRVGIKAPGGYKGYTAEVLRNHKMVSVEWLDEKMTVGSITIDQDETYHSHHTYLLDAGVYTKNTMLEDIWLPTRDGGRGTSVETLPAGELTGVLDDVLYFQKQLYMALNVPVGRVNSENNIFSTGRSSEITRDEVKFSKFIFRLRTKFSDLFLSILERQLILKNKLTYDDWLDIAPNIKFDFVSDNAWEEYKNLDIMQDRMNVLSMIEQFASKYYSHEWIRKNILMQTEQDIEEMDADIKSESENAQYHPELLAPQLGQQMDGPSPYAMGPTNEPYNPPPPPSFDPDMPGGPASLNTDQPQTNKFGRGNSQNIPNK